MKREENPGGSNIVTLIVIGAIGYFGYQYLVSSGLWAQWMGGTAPANASGLPTAAQIAAGLQSGAFIHAGTDSAGNIIVHQVATGAYYAVNSTTGAVSLASGPAPQGTVGTQPVTTVPITQPNTTATTPAATSTLATQLQAAATQFMANTGAAGLNIDQWVFYYQTIKGVTLSGSQVESLIIAAGLSDATRGTIIPLSTFMSALGGVGLSGIIPVPNTGPISAPLPITQNFRRGYGGYSSGGRRGYLN